MTDPVSPTNSPDDANEQPKPRRSRGWAYTLIIVLAAGLTGAFVSQAVSSGYGFGPGPWRGGWHHGGFMGRMDPAQIEDRADRAVRHLAIEIDATTEQQDKLRAIVTSAVKDLVPLRDKALAARQQARDLLTGTSVDRAAIEKFRADQMTVWDEASKRITQALGDAVEVLTPEQRQKIGELLPPRGGFWHGWRRG